MGENHEELDSASRIPTGDFSEDEIPVEEKADDGKLCEEGPFDRQQLLDQLYLLLGLIGRQRRRKTAGGRALYARPRGPLQSPNSSTGRDGCGDQHLKKDLGEKSSTRCRPLSYTNGAASWLRKEIPVDTGVESLSFASSDSAFEHTRAVTCTVGVVTWVGYRA